MNISSTLLTKGLGAVPVHYIINCSHTSFRKRVEILNQRLAKNRYHACVAVPARRVYITVVFSHRTYPDVSSTQNLFNVFFCNSSINGAEAQMQKRTWESTPRCWKQQNKENWWVIVTGDSPNYWLPSHSRLGMNDSQSLVTRCQWLPPGRIDSPQSLMPRHH